MRSGARLAGGASVRDLLTRFLHPYRKQLAIVVVLLLFQAIGNLYLPSLNADIINNGVVKGDAAYIVRVGALMLVVTLLVGGCAVLGVYFSARTAMASGRDIRGSMFRNVESFSLRELNEFGAPSLITRNTNDVQQVQMLVLLGLTMMISAPLMAIGGIFMAMREDVQLSALLLLIIPLMATVVAFMVVRAVPLFRSMQKKIDRINGVLRENLSGIRVIRAFVRTDYEQRRFADVNADLTATALSVTRLFAVALPALMLIMNLSTVAIMWFGGHLVDNGQMPIGNLTAFLSYIMLILTSVLMAVMMLIMVPRAAVSAERIQQVLVTQTAIVDPAAPTLPTRPARGVVEFRDVEFRYPGAEVPVLQHVSFTLHPGQLTAVVGSTGSGKTTLINLIPRLYDVTGGAVVVDGRDVRAVPQSEVRGLIGFVPQRSMMFGGTVASNLRFGKEDATEEQMWHALGVAQAREFVEQMPGGLDAAVDQGGANVSGGQRQRLAIARAVVRQPKVYVFDDSFSALDFATDARLRAALKGEAHDATVLIVAQRVSSIMHADQIIVLDAGSVVGIGTHAELMSACATYREIVYSQLTEDEVA